MCVKSVRAVEVFGFVLRVLGGMTALFSSLEDATEFSDGAIILSLLF